MGVSERKQREREQRRTSIIFAAEEIFFSRGIAAATVDEIATAAELSKGTVYLYFKNKEELIAAVFSRGMELLQNMMISSSVHITDPVQKLQSLGKTYLRFAREYPGHFALMLEKELHKLDVSEETPEAVSCIESGLHILTILKMIIIEGIQQKKIRPDIDPAQMALIIWGQIHGVITIASREEGCDHFKPFCTFDLESIVLATIDIILKGVEPRVEGSTK